MVRTDELLEVVEELADFLAKGRDLPVLSFTGERSPLELEFIYDPPAHSPTDANPAPEINREAPQTVPVPEGLAENMKCTLCSDRMYPVRRFRRSGNLPVLLLHYNGAVFDTKAKPDRSQNLIFGGEEEDGLFRRMFTAAGWNPDDLNYQEFPACHFNPARSMPEDWNDRSNRCMVHLEATLDRAAIRLILLTGPAAIFLLGEERAKAHAQSGAPIELPFPGRTIPALVLRSPAALLAYEKKREALKGATGLREQERYKKLVQEEKEIKHAILDALKKARSAVL